MIFIFPRGHLSGLQWSTAGSSTSFTVTAGQASDSTNAVIMNFPAAMTKSVLAWSAGSGNGGLDTGGIANNTWYCVYLIATPAGATDILYSLSATSPTLPSGYVYFRRICSAKTNGSLQWILVHQNGDEFLLDAAVLDVNTTITVTTAILATLSVPTNIQVNALFHAELYSGTGNNAVIISSPDESDIAPNGTTNSSLWTFAGYYAASDFNKRTNTAAQIRYRSYAVLGSPVMGITTYGWIDRRGRDS